MEFYWCFTEFRQNDEDNEARVMQVQSNSGPAGIGPATASPTALAVESAPPPTPPPTPVDAPDPVVEREAAQAATQHAAQQSPAAQVESRAVAPRARLTFDTERSEVFVEVLNPSNGDVLFSFPAKEAEQAFQSGLTQGSLVDQYA